MKKILSFLLVWMIMTVVQFAGASGENSVQSTGRSTDKLPQMDDFDWFWNRETGEMNTSIPNSAEAITDPTLLDGGWMVFVMRRPFADPYPEYWNIHLQVSDDQVHATQFWSGICENGSFTDWSAANSNSFDGAFAPKSCLLKLRDDFGCEILVPHWFELHGALYGIGMYYCVFPTDTEDPAGLIAFYRP